MGLTILKLAGQWLVQWLLVFPATLICTLPFLVAMNRGVSAPHSAWPEILLLLATGLGLGVLIGRWIPALIPSGAWIWFIPGFLMALVFLSAPQNIARNLYEFTTIGSGGQGLGAVLFAMPAAANSGYSLGIWWGGRRCKRFGPHE